MLRSDELQPGREEPVSDTARVLSAFTSAIVVRTFSQLEVEAIAGCASVPVINALTDLHHPCQALSDLLTLQEHFGTTDLRGKKYVLTWTYHPKALNTAVANSALTIATRYGMDVTLLCPTPDYVLDERYMQFGAQNAAENGGSLI
jgi:N-acetylornithine carbamoyltransferase